MGTSHGDQIEILESGGIYSAPADYGNVLIAGECGNSTHWQIEMKECEANALSIMENLIVIQRKKKTCGNKDDDCLTDDAAGGTGGSGK